MLIDFGSNVLQNILNYNYFLSHENANLLGRLIKYVLYLLARVVNSMYSLILVPWG